MLYVNKIFAYGKPRAHLVFISLRTVKLYETQSTVEISFWVLTRRLGTHRAWFINN